MRSLSIEDVAKYDLELMRLEVAYKVLRDLETFEADRECIDHAMVVLKDRMDAIAEILNESEAEA